MLSAHSKHAGKWAFSLRMGKCLRSLVVYIYIHTYNYKTPKDTSTVKKNSQRLEFHEAHFKQRYPSGSTSMEYSELWINLRAPEILPGTDGWWYEEGSFFISQKFCFTFVFCMVPNSGKFSFGLICAHIYSYFVSLWFYNLLFSLSCWLLHESY